MQASAAAASYPLPEPAESGKQLPFHHHIGRTVAVDSLAVLAVNFTARKFALPVLCSKRTNTKIDVIACGA